MLCYFTCQYSKSKKGETLFFELVSRFDFKNEKKWGTQTQNAKSWEHTKKKTERILRAHKEKNAKICENTQKKKLFLFFCEYNHSKNVCIHSCFFNFIPFPFLFF